MLRPFINIQHEANGLNGNRFLNLQNRDSAINNYESDDFLDSPINKSNKREMRNDGK